MTEPELKQLLTAITPPSHPAVWVPAKVAQFTPSEPGVISAMVIKSVNSLMFSQ